MKKVILSAALALFMLSGCATIIHGSRQAVGVSSSPSGASVYIDGQLIGKTPTIANLTRKNFHHVKILLPGYLPYETDFVRKVNAWIAGNIVFGGLIGLAIDAITGSMYKLTPDQISAELRSSASSVTSRFTRKALFVMVVLKPDKKWKEIGHLNKAE